MFQFDPAGDARRSRPAPRFILYMEGPRDRGILRAWAYRLMPSLAGRIFDASVILGGRQPARAVDHFRRERGVVSLRAVCVLDRDDGAAAVLAPALSEPGLEFFTWSRRHIESYLLVPAAIRRALRLPENDRRVDRVLREHLPSRDGEDAYREVDAKRLLGPRGPVPRALGRNLPLAGIARCTRASELHPDVHQLFGRFRECLSDDG